jgi:integrase
MQNRINFTKAAVEAMECPADRPYVCFYDTKRAGLCVLVTRNGHKAFYLYRRIDGRPERVRLGSFPPLTVEQARESADRENGRIAEGQNPAELRRRQRGEMTLADVFARYLDEHAKVHKRTWEDDQAQYDLHLAGLKGRKLSAISRRDVTKVHTDLGATKPYAANRILALLSKVYAFAAAHFDYAGPNPCKGVKRFREHERERFLDADEMRRFLAALDKHADQQMADLFRLLLFTGARRSSVQAMAWADVNFGRPTWTIPAADSKSGESVTVHLTEPALAVLRRRWAERVEGNPYVFPSRGRTMHVTEPKAAWKEVLTRAGITDLRVHDLRRTAGSWMAMGGASLPMIGKALGHRSTQSTKVYARMNLTPIAAALDTATAAMLAAAPKAKKGKARKKTA